jgi:hypothetical protein
LGWLKRVFEDRRRTSSRDCLLTKTSLIVKNLKQPSALLERVDIPVSLIGHLKPLGPVFLLKRKVGN